MSKKHKREPATIRQALRVQDFEDALRKARKISEEEGAAAQEIARTVAKEVYKMQDEISKKTTGAPKFYRYGSAEPF